MLVAERQDFAKGWRGVCLVAITYVYFLIFAQFAFLKRLGQLGIMDDHLQLVMAAMALGGVAFSLLASLRAFEQWPGLRLKISLLVCGAAAMLTLLPLSLSGSVAVSFLIGCGLGMLTVTLVSNLRLWIGARGVLWKVGLGTGLGYFICNVPALFTATPNAQALCAAVLCVLGIVIGSRTDDSEVTACCEAMPERVLSFGVVLSSFTALVWLDSAAFFIIQNTPILRAGTWQGTLHLWANGSIHLVAALASAFFLRRRGLSFVLSSAAISLLIACLLLHEPGQILLASLFYPLGVSLYSVALIAYPSFLTSSMSPHERAFKAGSIYAVAGWFGSAMGIGMGQHLRQVPIAFALLATLLVLGLLLFPLVGRYWRVFTVIGGTMLVALCIYLVQSASASGERHALTAEERGRKTYIAEGCINCHSQYVRPGTADVLMWGPAETIKELRSQHPPLIGNRRQGPDLSQVGGRRSPLWLKAHFMNPRELSHASFMPSYSYLFEGSNRGDDLVQYLESLKSPAYPERTALEQSWQLSQASVAFGSPQEGARLFNEFCATCHDTSGATRSTWRSQFKRQPPNLQTGPWQHMSNSETSEQRLMRVARIVKFGISGTDMPGHEYLSDKDVASISLWLNASVIPPQQTASIEKKSGEEQ